MVNCKKDSILRGSLAFRINVQEVFLEPEKAALYCLAQIKQPSKRIVKSVTFSHKWVDRKAPNVLRQYYLSHDFGIDQFSQMESGFL